jgi:hypothetical protein
LYQIKATVRSSNVRERAATASEALRIFQKTQATQMLRSCSIMRRGVIISQAELEQEARKEQANIEPRRG